MELKRISVNLERRHVGVVSALNPPKSEWKSYIKEELYYEKEVIVNISEADKSHFNNREGSRIT